METVVVPGDAWQALGQPDFSFPLVASGSGRAIRLQQSPELQSFSIGGQV